MPSELIGSQSKMAYDLQGQVCEWLVRQRLSELQAASMILGQATASQCGAFVRIRDRHPLWAHSPCEQNPGCISAPALSPATLLGILEQFTTFMTDHTGLWALRWGPHQSNIAFDGLLRVMDAGCEAN